MSGWDPRASWWKRESNTRGPSVPTEFGRREGVDRVSIHEFYGRTGYMLVSLVWEGRRVTGVTRTEW